jgi:hypothetical protein
MPRDTTATATLILLASVLTGCPRSETPADSGTTGDGGVDAGPCAVDTAARLSCDRLPHPESGVGPCCYEEAIACGSPSFRLRIASIDAPTSGFGIFLRSGLIQRELLNMLVTVERDPFGSDDVAVQLDYGERGDGGFRVYDGDAPSPDWIGGVRAPGQIVDGQLHASPFAGRRTVSSVDSYRVDPPRVDVNLYDLQITGATLTSGWSCVGGLGSLDWEPGGDLRAYALVADMDETFLYTSTGEPVLGACAALAGLASPLARCADTDRSLWPTLPTASCDGVGCTELECDPLVDCNAFRIDARFAAYGVRMGM